MINVSSVPAELSTSIMEESGVYKPILLFEKYFRRQKKLQNSAQCKKRRSLVFLSSAETLNGKKYNRLLRYCAMTKILHLPVFPVYQRYGAPAQCSMGVRRYLDTNPPKRGLGGEGR